MEKTKSEGCPVQTRGSDPIEMKGNQEKYNEKTNDLVFGNDIHPDQQVPLSKKRVISTIPKGDFTPDHQPEGMDHWVYPSQQQYYNAMKRKGYNPDEKDVEIILAIHNIVNEKGWQQVKEWEELNGCKEPKLVRFMGRPTDISPKAYLRSLLGYTPPFDRHDWLIDSNGKEVRYVIDFYTGDENSPTTSQSPRPKGERPHIAMHLDVRPALDTPQALFLRFKFSTMKFLQKYSSLFPFSTLFPKFGGSSSTDSSSKSSTEEKKK